ncbi:MAG: transglutaminase-like domain-containing protein [Promethearchaeota archaeon]
MNASKCIFLSILLFIPNLSLIVFIPPADLYKPSPIELFGEGVSHDNVNQSVTYEIEINFELTHTDPLDDQTYHLNVARINDLDPDNTNTKYTPEYQEVEMKKNDISGYDPPLKEYTDEFGNNYDCFNSTLDGVTKATIEINQKYEVKLNEIYFDDDIKDSDIDDYDYSDEVFDLYCNHTQKYYRIDDSDLISLSNNIVKTSDNPIEKAEKIYDWVIKNLDYDDNMPSEEKGASWAYDNMRGDCSEFSSLMVTLLRIQQIPARKVVGFVVSNDPTLRPEIGDTWEYETSYDGSTKTTKTNFLGHAWVQYYVAGIGWMVADPTWGLENHFNYFNRIDYFHVGVAVGQWIAMMGGALNYSEFPFLPSPAWSDLPLPDDTAFDFETQAKITVTDTDLIPLEEFPLLMWIIIISIIIGIVVIAIIIIVRKKKKKRI